MDRSTRKTEEEQFGNGRPFLDTRRAGACLTFGQRVVQPGDGNSRRWNRCNQGCLPPAKGYSLTKNPVLAELIERKRRRIYWSDCE